MSLSISDQYKIFDEAQKNNLAFRVDWKSPVEDIIFNIKRVLPQLNLESVPEKQVLGDWIESMILDGKEYSFKAGSETLISDVVGTVNEYIRKNNQTFVLIEPDDNWDFILINLSELPDYLEKGFIKV